MIIFGCVDRTPREILLKRLEGTPSNALCFVKRLHRDVLTDFGRPHGHRTWYRGAACALVGMPPKMTLGGPHNRIML